MNHTSTLLPIDLQSSARTARGKMKSIAELAEIAAQAKAQGKTVALCHGTFDLLHMGHVRHIEAAKREGDLLMVTVTADAFVNKGPGRPVFPDNLRAEMVASVEYVDFVAVSHGPTADPLIKTIKPDVYVKGVEYKAEGDDVTGGIVPEREAVEAHGGRIAFTEELTFSSSNLINRNLNVYEPELNEYLAGMREQDGLARLLDMVERIKDYRILFVGDAILDQYSYVEPLGKSAKENMIATLHQGDELFAGGVFAAANHVAGFCKEVEIVTLLGERESHEEFIRASLKPNVKFKPLYRPLAPTTRKSRFVDPYSLRKLFEVYHMDDKPLQGSLYRELNTMLKKRIAEFDLVVVTDFGHGLIDPGTAEILQAKSKLLCVNAQSNAGNYGFNPVSKYRKADYICLDGPEAKLAVHNKYADPADLAARDLPDLIDCNNVVVTAGKHGCYAWRKKEGLHRVPALTNSIVDTVGAGDAFFAVSAPFLKAGASMADLGFLGNAAGAMKVGIVGHRSSIQKPAFVKFLTAMLK